MGVILAGGDSTRMGCDKALLHVSANETLLARSWALISRLTDFCVISCAPGHPYNGFECIEDAPGPKGPCRGILASMQEAESLGFTTILALACDLPGMTEAALRELMTAHASAPSQIWATLYQSALTGRIEMLAGVYSTRFLPHLKAGMEQGIQSLYWLLPAENRQCLGYGTEMKETFINCNTKADLEKFARLNKNSG